MCPLTNLRNNVCCAATRWRRTLADLRRRPPVRPVRPRPHSLPEGIDIATTIAEDEVCGLFRLWNDSLATLDSDAVTKRYAKQGVLLPTASDVPRTDYAGIKDYFDAFLLKKPQGTILESNVLIGTNWCQDAGISEFDLLGATVKA